MDGPGVRRRAAAGERVMLTACQGSLQLRCPGCGAVFCVPGVCRGGVVWHRGCDGTSLAEAAVETGEPVVRAVVSWFKDTGRLEVRVCAEG